jgi:hypothetical protein
MSKRARYDLRAPGTEVIWEKYCETYPHDKFAKRGEVVQGIVLALDDPVVWANTGVFPMDEPDPEAVRRHVALCQENGLFDDLVAAQWFTGRIALAPVSELVAIVNGQLSRPLQGPRPKARPKARPPRPRPARTADDPNEEVFVALPMPQGPPPDLDYPGRKRRP